MNIMKKLLAIICTLALLATSSTLAACGGTGTPVDTGAQTEGNTSAPTQAADGTEADTPTEPAATETEEATEEATEEETFIPVENIPTVNTTLCFHTDENLNKYLSLEGCEAEIYADREVGTVLKLTSTEAVSQIVFDVSAYLKAHNLEPLSAEVARYAVFNLKTENFKEGRLSLSSLKTETGKGVRLKQTAKYDETAEGWQQVIGTVSLDAGTCLGSLTFTLFKNIGEVVLLKEIVMFNNTIELADYADSLKGYRLGNKTDMEVKDSDPIEHKTLTAANEDASLKLAFDHITEKKAQSDTNLSDRAGYTIRMAKNEIQGCQFFLTSDTDHYVTAEISDFTDGNGNTLETSLCWEFYHTVKTEMLPDALPPLAPDTTVAVLAGKSQGFVIKAKTTAETPAGTYKATVNVRDAGTGNVIKTAEVYTVVWNFTLSDETACEVVTGLSAYSIYPTLSDEKKGDIERIYINYYDWLLENRVNAYNLPVSWDDERAVAYYNNPRVRRFKLDEASDRSYQFFAEHQDWAAKAYFYIVDEPTDSSKMDRLMQTGEQLEAVYPGYHMVSPFFTDINYNREDQIAFMEKVCDIWCVKPFAYTPRDLSFIAGTQYLQTERQDKTYGTFAERMEKQMAEGDTVWTYVCWEPEEPYANWMINDDGTQTVVSLWQCKMLGVDGMLYWSCCYWDTSNLFGYGNVVTAPNGSTPVWGDGVLIYPGSPFGLDIPVSSLRLEGVRNGIQDYEYLTMLEKVCGKEVMDEYISLITTSVITFTEDDDRLAAVHAMLGDRLEAELNK